MQGGEQLLINEVKVVCDEIASIHDTLAPLLDTIYAKQLAVRSSEVDDAVSMYTKYILRKYRDTSQLYSKYLDFLQGQGKVLNTSMISKEWQCISLDKLSYCLYAQLSLLTHLDKLTHESPNITTSTAISNIIHTFIELFKLLHMLYFECYAAHILIGKVKNSTGTGIGTYKNDLSVELEKLYTKLLQASEAYSVFTPKYNKLIVDCKQINFADFGLVNNTSQWFMSFDKAVIEFHKVRDEMHKVYNSYKLSPHLSSPSSPSSDHPFAVQPQVAPQVSTGTAEAAHTTTTAITTASAAASVDTDIKVQPPPPPLLTDTDPELANDGLSLTAHYPPGSVIASITVEFATDVTMETTPETSPDSITDTDASPRQPIQSSVETKRLLAELTFTGCISGHTPLDWQVTGLDYKWGTQRIRAHSALRNE